MSPSWPGGLAISAVAAVDPPSAYGAVPSWFQRRRPTPDNRDDRKLARRTWAAARLPDRSAKLHTQGMFDWNDLKHFLAFARQGSTVAAAKMLGVNQSTVHRRLAELEKCLGRRLVERNLTGYRLTELGEELRPYAERVEDAVTAL